MIDRFKHRAASLFLIQSRQLVPDCRDCYCPTTAGCWCARWSALMYYFRFPYFATTRYLIPGRPLPRCRTVRCLPIRCLSSPLSHCHYCAIRFLPFCFLNSGSRNSKNPTWSMGASAFMSMSAEGVCCYPARPRKILSDTSQNRNVHEVHGDDTGWHWCPLVCRQRSPGMTRSPRLGCHGLQVCLYGPVFPCPSHPW